MRYNRKTLAQLYGISTSTLYNYLVPHRKQLIQLATRRFGIGRRIIISNNFNSRQLKYIVEKVLLDTPFGYDFNGKYFVKNDDKE